MTGESQGPGRYRAFISYSHADEAAARRIHRALELYRVPRRLAGTVTAAGAVPARLTPIFRDREELPAATDLSATIKEALARSDALIVLCSPAARGSQWVAREIEVFRQVNPDRPVLAALLDGEPAEAFPPNLLPAGPDDVEPIAADFRKGRDGRRLARLKLVAGLTGLRLDSLVQRDAQRQIRRVTTITLGAVVAMLAMALLLVLALEARREAERQRTEAEGLVEFMLTDLRSRLKAVGRLDVMDSVNRRAIAYYGDRHTLGRLSDDSLERRARILHAMAEDQQSRGEYDRALAFGREAHASTEAVLARHPDDPKAIFAHAQSEYWLGAVYEVRRDWGPAERQYQRYFDASVRLIALQPDNPDYMLERGWGALNLGHIRLHGSKDAEGAEKLYRDAIDWFARAAGASKKDKGPALREEANAIGDLADALLARGDLRGALAERRREHAINLELVRDDPKNVDRVYVLAISERAVARMADAAGEREPVRPLLESAHARIDWLLTREPKNADWLLVKALIACDMRAILGLAPADPLQAKLRTEVEAVAATLREIKSPRIAQFSRCLSSIESQKTGG